jgi:hypothetical protein
MGTVSTADKPSQVLNPKYATAYVVRSDNTEVLLGVLQGVTITVNYSVERAIELGETFMLPVSGYKFVTLTARRMLVPQASLIALLGSSDDPYDLATASKKGLTSATIKLVATIKDKDNQSVTKTFEIVNANLSSWSVAYDSGGLFIFEDIVMEAADLKIENQ